MKAAISGQDYIIVIEEGEDLSPLENGGTLESDLLDDETGKILNKKVTLELCAKTTNYDGIELVCLPEKRSGWKDIKHIRIKMLPSALNQAKSSGHFGTRYDCDNMITLYYK